MRGTEVAAEFYTTFELAREVSADPEAYLRYATTLAMRSERSPLSHEWASQKSSEEPNEARSPQQKPAIARLRAGEYPVAASTHGSSAQLGGGSSNTLACLSMYGPCRFAAPGYSSMS
jgi:hypothetical protein